MLPYLNLDKSLFLLPILARKEGIIGDYGITKASATFPKACTKFKSWGKVDWCDITKVTQDTAEERQTLAGRFIPEDV